MSTPHQFYALAQTKGMPTAVRVQYAAMARADRHGRAIFEPGQLRRLTGLPENSRTQLNDAIRRLVEWGIAAPGANSGTIVLNPALIRHRAPVSR
jgi:hypothetical protein